MSRTPPRLNGRSVYPVELTQTKTTVCYVAATSPEEAEQIAARSMNDSECWYETDGEIAAVSNRLPWTPEAFAAWVATGDDESGILHMEPGTDWPIWDEAYEWAEKEVTP